MIVVNLAGLHGSEGRLSRAYQAEAVRFAATTPGVGYVDFDFHKECGATRYELPAGVAPLCFEVPVDDAAGMLLHEHVPRQTPWTVPWFTCCLRAAAREPRLPCRLHAN